MLLMHAIGDSPDAKTFEGIVVASERILDSDTINKLAARKTRVYFALENKWL